MNTIPTDQGPTVAVIDIGTNSVKLLIAEVSPVTGTVVEKMFLRDMTRIGGGVSETGEINAAALLRTINAIERFRRFFQQYDCNRVFAYSTHAFRAAKNGRKAAARIEDETSVDIRTLSGEEEARFAFLSARARLDRLKPHTYMIDVGGGSVEFVHASGENIIAVRSLPLGALHLTERFLRSDPIGHDETARLRTHIKNALSLLFEGGELAGPRSSIPASKTDLVASGGAIYTIKRMSDQSWVHGSVTTPKVRIGDVRRLEAECLALPLEKRKRLPGLDPERADIMPAGLAVVIAFMEATGKRVLKLNPGGVRDGVLIHLAQNNFQW